MELDFTPQIIAEKEKKTLNKPFRTPNGPKKFSVYVKNEKGNIVKVNFGDPKMEIKRDDPERRKNFRARHNCDNPGPKTKAAPPEAHSKGAKAPDPFLNFSTKRGTCRKRGVIVAPPSGNTEPTRN